MPKQPKPAPNPIERVAPNDPRLPPSLQLAEVVDAEVLPDGRVVPLLLPPAVRALYYADLADAPTLIGGEDIAEAGSAPQDASVPPLDVPPAPAVEEL